MITSLRLYLIVALGAIPGVLTRYWLVSSFNNILPIGTFLVNISGAFLMGLVSSLILARWSLNEEIRLFLSTGFLGSYTTFSTYQLDSVVLLTERTFFDHILYWLGTPLVGIICFCLGITLAKRFNQFPG